MQKEVGDAFIKQIIGDLYLGQRVMEAELKELKETNNKLMAENIKLETERKPD